MADVYRSAEKVVVWLGPKRNGSDLALAAMATIASKLQVDWNHLTINPASEDTEFSWLDVDNPLPLDDKNRCEPLNESALDFPKTMTRFLRLADLTEEVSDDFLRECMEFLLRFYDCAVGRAFIVTHNEGLIGLALEACRENDCIVILLGCQSPMVLRPTNDGSFLVVGECYVDGLMEGEALLGPLPSNWRRVTRFDEETKLWWDMFEDHDQGVWQVEDPRLGPLPKGRYEVEHPKQHLYAKFRDETEDTPTSFDPRMLPSSLRERGVELQDFNLV
ncbi:MAG: hypothetical protein LQ348_006808 [Seirophora lacunosa]|nr:MAG: hypothetical protein LQ348_006808 [Seirophora lacunosa]